MPRLPTIRLNFLTTRQQPPPLDRRCLKCRRKQKSSLGDRCLSCSAHFRPERRRATYSSARDPRLPTLHEEPEDRAERRRSFAGFVVAGEGGRTAGAGFTSWIDTEEEEEPCLSAVLAPRPDNTMDPVFPVLARKEGKENVPPGLQGVKGCVDDWFEGGLGEVEGGLGGEVEEDWWEGEWRRVVDEEMRAVEDWAMGGVGIPVGGF